MSALNQKAILHINSKANELLAELRLLPKTASPNNNGHASNDVHISHQIGPEDIDIQSIREKILDFRGVAVACFFHKEGMGRVGFEDNSHSRFLEFIRYIASTEFFEPTLSEEFIYGQAIDWFRTINTKGQAVPETSFVEFLQKAAEISVTTQEVWLPLPTVSIPCPIRIGKVVFRRITKSMIDEMVDRFAQQEVAAITNDPFLSLRKQIQGATAACLTVMAEPIKARQIINSEAEASIALFRLACPALFTPFQWAPISPEQFENKGGHLHLIVRHGAIQNTFHSAPENLLLQWVIKPKDVSQVQKMWWGFANTLLDSERNDFQNQLLGALIHYSKSVLKPEPSERLMYIFAALESILVNKNEAIAQNLSERLAIINCSNPQKRKATAKLVKRVYGLRSKFVHAAHSVQSVEQLEEFFLGAGTFFLFAIENHSLWKTKTEFLDFVDSYKFSGPAVDTRGLATGINPAWLMNVHPRSVKIKK